MAFLHSFAVPDFLDSLVSLFAAFVLGTLIGAERQYRQRGGGLRTHVLVAVGAGVEIAFGRNWSANAEYLSSTLPMGQHHKLCHRRCKRNAHHS